MNFSCTFRTTALKEIGKIYTVQGRKFFLSFTAPYTCVFFCVLLSGGFSRFLQREELHQYKLRAQNRSFFKWNKSTGNLVAFLATWPLFMKLRTCLKCGSKAICSELPNQPVGHWINAHDFNFHRLRRYRESRIVAKLIASSVVL